ncbi:DnaJ C-terminal domain-containing protein [Rubricoccus marinus]|uniref:J domain-containing protein n=1 Tax=Rubricoccus marinus TaxID=716817 RepID=A0A259U1P5_9BACT|nr:DnaJ C-terminal domain-containing protein [Rubricoccus marinus]OZC03902.1 hypothetical protein BSZ36_13455 [Rubricoccus marinus]
MAEISNHYHVLDVSETASHAEIKRAYRSLAQELHPDRNAGAHDRLEHFREIQEAYEVLSNPSARLEYDRMRFGLGDAGRDMHASVHFGAAFAISKAYTRSHVEAEVRLMFEQALKGGHTSVTLTDGTAVQVPVPQGVRSGVKVRFKEKGPESESGKRSDLYVVFRVAPSPRFRREGNDLHIVEPITVIEALLGTQRAITNAYGRSVKISVSPGTQPGERLRLRGQGVRTATQCGDLYVEVRMIVPRSLTEEQREALAACVRSLGLQ